jgi:hypothetical protein
VLKFKILNSDASIIKTKIINSDNITITARVNQTYILPVASATILGGVKIGSHLSITSDGVIDTIFSIDDALSTDSTNPVQNKILTEALNKKQDKLNYVLTYEDVNI